MEMKHKTFQFHFPCSKAQNFLQLKKKKCEQVISLLDHMTKGALWTFHDFCGHELFDIPWVNEDTK